MTNLDRPSKSSLELHHQVFVNTVRARQNGGSDLRCDHQRHDRQRESPPFAYTVHDVREFRRLLRKWEATLVQVHSMYGVSARYGAFGSNEYAAASATAYPSRFSAAEKSCSAHNPHCWPRPTNRSKKAGP